MSAHGVLNRDSTRAGNLAMMDILSLSLKFNQLHISWVVRKQPTHKSCGPKVQTPMHGVIIGLVSNEKSSGVTEPDTRHIQLVGNQGEGANEPLTPSKALLDDFYQLQIKR